MTIRSPHRNRTFAAAAVLALLLTVYGCASTHRPAPVSERAPAAAQSAAMPAPLAAARGPEPRPEYYTVKKGDTLYTIALDHGLDYKELAEWNGVANPNLIKLGQQLRLRAPASTAVTAPLRSAPAVAGQPVGGSASPPAAGVTGTGSEAVK